MQQRRDPTQDSEPPSPGPSGQHAWGRPRLAKGAALLVAVVGLVVMVWAPSNWPIVGLLLLLGGLAAVIRDVALASGSTAPGPTWAGLLWRRSTGGPGPTGAPTDHDLPVSPR
ncbi:MAG TPA: hypothetical protein VF143_12545 [Candidatus Nanopelagicales bacterium]